MRILVISQPVWSDENNGGNTLSNLFGGFDAEFANIYFADGEPNNQICHRYFQISDHMLVDHYRKGSPIGKRFDCAIAQEKAEITGFDKKYKSYNNFYTTLLRELMWKVTNIYTKELYAFIDDFQPDVIYAPCYGKGWMLRFVHRIKKYTGVPLVSYISDDLYYPTSSEHTPMKKLYRLEMQKALRRLFRDIDRFYTMTDEQREAYEPLYKGEMHLLRKSSVVEYVPHQPAKVKRLIYAGGTYFGRSEVLQQLRNVIRKLNRGGKRFELHIYSGSHLSEEELAVLDDKINSYFHGTVPYKQLLNEYKRSDIALHVESFETKNTDITRLSFSTKILDCLQSGAPVLVIAPLENAGCAYLKREKAAYCVGNLEMIEDGLLELSENYEKWQENAYRCLMKNHNGEVNRRKLQEDFENVILEAKK